MVRVAVLSLPLNPLGLPVTVIVYVPTLLGVPLIILRSASYVRPEGNSPTLTSIPSGTVRLIGVIGDRTVIVCS